MSHKEQPVNDFGAVMSEGAILVDVREPAEVAGGTLPGAINIPLGTLPDRLEELDKSSAIVLLCRSGARSDHAAQFLAQNGYADVTNLVGGMLAYTG